MLWLQQKIKLPPFKRGFHLITPWIEELQILKSVEIGLINLFLTHTSASLTINENADPTVRKDFEKYFNKLAPEHLSHYEHSAEGSDDMPAHLKSSILGVSLTVPISKGILALGTWQGVYLCEHRDTANQRDIIVTILGESS